MTTLQSISIHEPTSQSVDFADGMLSHDLYREVHKAIRFAMFHTTMNVGSLDVTDPDAVEAFAGFEPFVALDDFRGVAAFAVVEPSAATNAA